MKKRGLGKGRWNGFGGKVEQGESFEQAALRELREEVGLVADKLLLMAELYFFNEDVSRNLHAYVFTTDIFSGTPVETEEMNPKWFSFQEIPFSRMWPDDQLWLPSVLEGKKVHGKFTLRDFYTISDYTINEL